MLSRFVKGTPSKYLSENVVKDNPNVFDNDTEKEVKGNYIIKKQNSYYIDIQRFTLFYLLYTYKNYKDDSKTIDKEFIYQNRDAIMKDGEELFFDMPENFEIKVDNKKIKLLGFYSNDYEESFDDFVEKIFVD